jgi:hypothetical protein
MIDGVDDCKPEPQGISSRGLIGQSAHFEQIRFEVCHPVIRSFAAGDGWRPNQFACSGNFFRYEPAHLPRVMRETVKVCRRDCQITIRVFQTHSNLERLRWLSFCRIAISKKEGRANIIMKFSQVILLRHLQIPLFALLSFGCGIFPSSHDAVLPLVPARATSQSPGNTVEIKRTAGNVMLYDSSPVYEHPDKASAIIAYVPQGTHENVADDIGDWLLIRLPDGKVGFIPNDALKPK